MNRNLVTFTARDAKTRFGEVLDEALGSPVGITRHDRLTAYIVSKRDFDALRERVQDLEDQLWLAKANAAREEGFASASDVDAFLSFSRNLGHEHNDDKPGPEGLQNP
ncbi:prevent-host-death family protein [Paraburkholderia tropica]|uniref:type II toxin-antitoxin system Phd/YefM family antitoxin n=1 Tax=Paraburkholderia tropica TaxID=92647 RepID=UPI00160AE559|nr:type II toxin-antitoxin system Phd/YefM family antitoxin [Paraburkholderia tropica]MBB3005336.1 prevent-host-death family protein [Paraburkholderia tropica]